MPRPGDAGAAPRPAPEEAGRLPGLVRRVLSWGGVRTVLDVGAHHGEFVRSLREDSGFTGAVVSFEPDPDSHDRVARRAASDPGWRVEHLALSDRAGPATLQRFDRANFNSLQEPTDNVAEWFEIERLPATTVETVRLDGWLAGPGHDVAPPVFLKVDTQGHDWAVIEGVGDRLDDVVAIQLELSVLPLYRGTPRWTDVIARLEGLGFWAAGLFPVTRDPGLLRVTEFDGVFTRDV